MLVIGAILNDRKFVYSVLSSKHLITSEKKAFLAYNTQSDY